MNIRVLIKKVFLGVLIATLNPCSKNIAYATNTDIEENKEETLNDRLHKILVSTDHEVTNYIRNHMLSRIEFMMTNGPESQDDAAADFDEYLDKNISDESTRKMAQLVRKVCLARAQKEIGNVIAEEGGFVDVGGASIFLHQDVSDAIFNIRIALQSNEIVALVKQGADVNFRTESCWGLTPLHWVLKSHEADKKIPFIIVLHSLGADVNAKSTSGETPMHSAACVGAQHILTLHALGGDLNGKDDNGKTPMQEAIDWKNNRRNLQYTDLVKCYEVVKVLHELGADPLAVVVGEEAKIKYRRPSRTGASKTPFFIEKNLINRFLGGIENYSPETLENLLKSLREDECTTIENHLSISRYLGAATRVVPSLNDLTLNAVREKIQRRDITKEELDFLPENLLKRLYIPEDLVPQRLLPSAAETDR